MKNTFIKQIGNEKYKVIIDYNKYWSITYRCYENNKMISCGHCSETLLSLFPELKTCIDLHLSCSETGEPMHLVANGRFFLENREGEYTVKTIMKHFRLSESEAQKLMYLYENDEDFSFKKYCNSQRERFQKENDLAIKVLEKVYR